jgi:putative membrane protein
MKSLMLVLSIVGGAVLSGCSLFQWAMPGATLSDANVLAMLDTLNRSEIEAANLAQQKASSEEVRTFASQMLNNHITMSQETRQLEQRIKVQPETPALASTTDKAHRKMMEELRNKSGPAFDQSYVEYQIKMHEQAIGLVQDTAGSVDNPQLQQHLRQARPDLESHLSAAKATERQLVAQSQQRKDKSAAEVSGKMQSDKDPLSGGGNIDPSSKMEAQTNRSK